PADPERLRGESAGHPERGVEHRGRADNGSVPAGRVDDVGGRHRETVPGARSRPREGCGTVRRGAGRATTLKTSVEAADGLGLTTSFGRRPTARVRRSPWPAAVGSALSWRSLAWTATTAAPRSSPGHCATPAWRSSTPA